MVVLLISAIFSKKTPLKPAVTNVNKNAVYDAIKNSTDSATIQKAQEVKATLTNALGNHIIQTFQSGQIAALSLPADVPATTSALMRSGIKGFQITSEDYYITIEHLMRVDSSLGLCNSLTKTNIHSDMFLVSKKKLTSKTQAYVWRLKNQQGAELYQVNACHLDGGKKAWIIDYYFPVKIYLKKYENTINELVDSFIFTY